jgi:catechol 2,3-dioxygenase-like lactoylglutathione lyase family enzyme
MTVALFAGIRVRDLTAAREWYERLLGEPSFFPNATEVVWTLADDRSLYIEEDPGRAGGALITVFVDDLDARIADIGSRGLEPAERETYSNGVRKATYRDEDGNEVGFGGAALTAEATAEQAAG